MEKLNLLPVDGIADYYGNIVDEKSANSYFEILFESMPWKNDEAVIFGKHFITKRKVAWFGDTNFSYTYSNKTKEALLWTKELFELKELIEKITGASYNSCLLNLYHNGDEGMSWHSDDEKSLENHSSIASLSLGAVRKFSMKHRATKETVSIMLENGSLIVMKGEMQKHWLHSLPKSKKVKNPRINLTFRRMLE